MTRIGIFYGSTTSRTQEVAEQLAAKLGVAATEVRSITECAPEDLLGYDLLILGIPTWNSGELQEDWENFLPGLEDLDLNGRTVALFGLGDAVGYAFTYLDALGMLHEAVVARGARVIGHWPSEGYVFEESKAVIEPGLFCGLALDQDNEEDLSDGRIAAWTAQLQQEMAQ